MACSRSTARGVPVVYDAAKKTLTCGDKTAPLAPESGKVSLQILVDRGSIEVFGNNGRVAISHGVIPPEGNRTLSVSVTGGSTRIRALVVHELKSVWPAESPYRSAMGGPPSSSRVWRRFCHSSGERRPSASLAASSMPQRVWIQTVRRSGEASSVAGNSQMRAVLSSLPLIKRRPSGLQASAFTAVAMTHRRRERTARRDVPDPAGPDRRWPLRRSRRRE